MDQRRSFQNIAVECVAGAKHGDKIVRAIAPAAFQSQTLQQLLERSAALAPDRAFLRERAGDGWRTLRYSEALAQVRELASWLLSQGLSQEKPLAILSGNSIDHAVLSLAAMSVGIPVAPISAAYSQFKDLSRLREILQSLTPGLVFADNGDMYLRALSLANELGYPVSTRVGSAHEAPSITLAVSREKTEYPVNLEVTPDTVAKILFTSGSTGTPKGVLVTQRMMCSNQDAMAEAWPFLEDEPPVMVDWLPWNHVFGGCLNFNCVLRNAGTLFIDEGRPMPGRFEQSLRNIREARPTVYMGVPGAMTELARAFAADLSLEKSFFQNIRAMFSAGAALPQATWDALHKGCERATGKQLSLFIGWGSTETAPVVSLTRADCTRPDSIGLPLSAAEIKLTPNQDKMELRVRGPMVTPGYWRRPDLSAQAFDEEGFYAIGDAGKLDPTTWERDGILFDGRVAENFKLTSGTWVSVGPLRLAAIAAGAPIIDEVVITGHDRDEVGMLVFPNLAACRALSGLAQAHLPELAADPAVRDAVARALVCLSSQHGSSMQIRSAVLLCSPPSMESGEMTDKGYLNQRAALVNRAEAVERLYVQPRHPDVILPAFSH